MKKIYEENYNKLNIFEKINLCVNSIENWESQKFLTEFQNQPDSYLHIPSLIESSNPKIVYFGLQIIEHIIKYHWYEFVKEKKKFIQNLIIDLIFKYTYNNHKISQNLFIIRKMNLILVKIIIQSEDSIFIFIKDLIQSAKISECICENNLNIIISLFDEIFSLPNSPLFLFFQENRSVFTKMLKEVELLCYFVLSQKKFIFNNCESFIKITLTIFLKIITIAPPDYILEDYFLENFIFLCTRNKMKNSFLECLIEMINSPNILTTLLLSKTIKFFILQFQETISVSTDIIFLFEKTKEDLKQFIMNGAIFFLNFLKNWSFIVKNEISFYGLFILINQFMLKISCVPDLEIFKICIDWWLLLIEKIQNKELLLFSDTLNKFCFDDLKVIIINRMSKPEEVLLVENENGCIIREKTRDTDSITLYFKGKEILIYLAKLNEQSIMLTILNKLNFQFNKKIWNRCTLNSLCWSIGAISGIFSLESEKNFIVSIIKDLLYLAELKKGKDNKAIIASNIMYIIGQYPRFLKNHWKFLKTVIYKLFEFMNESHPGVQDMACDTFLKIGKTCATHISMLHENEAHPFLDEILNSSDKFTNLLEFHHIEQFYETLSIIIKSIANPESTKYYISILFEKVNKIWFNSLKKKLIEEDLSSIKKTVDLLKLNKKITFILEQEYYFGIKILFYEMNFFYEWSIEIITRKSERQNSNDYGFCGLQDFLHFKNEILDLIISYTVMTFYSNSKLSIKENFSHIIVPIITNEKNYFIFQMGDYRVIEFSIIILKKCKEYIEKRILTIIFEKVFITTLTLINLNFENYPDIKKFFFVLLKIIINDYFSLLFESNLHQSEEYFQLIIQAIVWGIKHSDINISKDCLKILFLIFHKVNNLNFGNYFYSKFFKQILIDLIFIIIDTLHRPNIKLQCKLFFHLINQAKKFINFEYIKYYIELIFTKAFPDLNVKKIEKIIIFFYESKLLYEFEKEFRNLLKITDDEWQNVSSDQSNFVS